MWWTAVQALAVGAVTVGVLASVTAKTDAAPDPASRYWPQWRGPAATGVAPEADPPVTWSETENVRWKVEIPGRGHASPVVWGDRVFVLTAMESRSAETESAQAPQPAGEAEAAAEEPRRRGGFFRPVTPEGALDFVVMALDRATGEVVWRRTARTAEPHEGTHTDGTWASASPITDGRYVWASFGSQGIYCYTFDGKKVWERDLGDMHTRHAFGEGASPALHGDTLVINWDHEGDSFLVALDAKTGEERWRRSRDEITSWATPVVVEVEGRPQVVVNATGKVRGYDLTTGEPLWETGGMTVNTIPSPVHGDGLVYVTSGFRGNALKAIRLAAAKGDVTGTEAVAWTWDRDTPYVPSPLLYDGTLYLLKHNRGILTVFEAKTGEVLYGPERLPEVQGVYASPVGAAGRVYVVGRDGTTVVLEHGSELEVLAVNRLDDGFEASPAVVDDEIFLRGRRHLYALVRGTKPASTAEGPDAAALPPVSPDDRPHEPLQSHIANGSHLHVAHSRVSSVLQSIEQLVPSMQLILQLVPQPESVWGSGFFWNTASSIGRGDAPWRRTASPRVNDRSPGFQYWRASPVRIFVAPAPFGNRVSAGRPSRTRS